MRARWLCRCRVAVASVAAVASCGSEAGSETRPSTPAPSGTAAFTAALAPVVTSALEATTSVAAASPTSVTSGCDGPVLGAFGSAAGELRVSESADGTGLCLEGGLAGRIRLDLTVEPDATPAIVRAAAWTGFGGYYLFAVPSSWLIDAIEVRTERNLMVPAFPTREGTRVLILDPDVDPASAGGRTFTVSRRDGSTLGQLIVPGPPASSGETRDPAGLLACLRAQGLNLPDPASMGPSDMAPKPATTQAGATPPDQQPYPDGVAATAWNACRSLVLASVTDARDLAFLDCMAELGWIQMFRGPMSDPAEHDTDASHCTT